MARLSRVAMPGSALAVSMKVATYEKMGSPPPDPALDPYRDAIYELRDEFEATKGYVWLDVSQLRFVRRRWLCVTESEYRELLTQSVYLLGLPRHLQPEGVIADYGEELRKLESGFFEVLDHRYSIHLLTGHDREQIRREYFPDENES